MLQYIANIGDGFLKNGYGGLLSGECQASFHNASQRLGQLLGNHYACLRSLNLNSPQL